MSNHDMPPPTSRRRPRSRRAQWLRRLLLYPVLVLVVVGLGLTVFYVATLYRPGPPQEGHLALTGATVLVGPDLEPREVTVLVRDGVIVAVGGDHEIDVPSSATTLDLEGLTLMPGLIDLHVHLGMPELDRGQDLGLAQMPRVVLDVARYVPGARRALLDHGVTSVRSLGDEVGWITELRAMVDDGELEGPRVFAAGPVFTTPGGHPIVTFGVGEGSDSVRVPGTPEEARREVRALATADEPVDLIKIVQERGDERLRLEPHTPDVLRAIVEEAHEHGLPVTGHWGTPEDLEELLAAGVDGLEHIEARGVLDGWPDELLTALVEADLALTPTLAVTDVALSPDDHEQLRARVAELQQAGVRIVVGSDAAVPGVGFGAGVHRELELLVAAGLTPTEALRGATSGAAHVLRSEQVGVIEPGRAADLLAVGGDPSTDITAVRDVQVVLRDGRAVIDRTAR